MAASHVDAGTDAALLQTQRREADASALPSSGTADEVVTEGGIAHTVVAATATPVWLPAPLSTLHLPLASLVGTSPAARASAEAACVRSLRAAQDRGPQSGPNPPVIADASSPPNAAADMVSRALAAVRAGGARGLSHQALGSCLLSNAPPQTEAPALQADAPDDRPQAGQPSASAGPTTPAGSAATYTRAAATTPLPPDPAAMAAATDALRTLLHHGLVRRMPGHSHVAYVASEHSQRYLLRPPYLPAPSLPRQPGQSAPVAVAGGSSMRAKESASGAASASADQGSTAAEPPTGVSQQAPQALSGAVEAEASASTATASAQSNVPRLAVTPESLQPAGRMNAVPQKDEGRPSTPGAPRAAPREQVARPWLDHAGGINVPLWRDLIAKAVTLVLRHPGTGPRQLERGADGSHSPCNHRAPSLTRQQILLQLRRNDGCSCCTVFHSINTPYTWSLPLSTTTVLARYLQASRRICSWGSWMHLHRRARETCSLCLSRRGCCDWRPRRPLAMGRLLSSAQPAI